MTMTLRHRPAVLCVLDGWGHRADASDNAITRAKTPVFQAAWASSPHALLDASEEHVGLPAGQIGNSEVGHMNLGAGRVVFQDLPMIDRAFAQGEVAGNAALMALIAQLKKSGGACHIMGLFSPGGVHAHQKHGVALARLVSAAGIPVKIHAFLDGRDVPPQSADEHIRDLVRTIAAIPDVSLASLCGRYYAMDRDHRWDRVQKAYNLVVDGVGVGADDAVAAIQASYASGIGDEFVLPVVLNDYKGMQDGDGVLFINYRADRAREILQAFVDPSFDGFPRARVVRLASAVGMVDYSDKLNAFMTALFPPKVIENTLGSWLSHMGLTQLRIAETEKYPHVTFFFNGGREEPYRGEERVMIPSPKVATYDLQPEMSAAQVTDKVVEAINSDQFDFIVINFANPDMVGHTGFFDAAVRAVEALDVCLGRLFDAVKGKGGFVVVTADHGNCEQMCDPDTGGAHTAHTLERVPLMIVNAPGDVRMLRDGKLADVAPTLLHMMGLPVPAEMDGQNLIVG